MFVAGQTRKWIAIRRESALPRSTDIVRPGRLVRFVPEPEVGVHCRHGLLRKFGKQRLRLLQIARVEPLRKPAIYCATPTLQPEWG